MRIKARSEANELQDIAAGLAVDQHEIGLDVSVANQRMVHA
ncbi:MAG: hypothetical protein ACREVI_13450 [Steroidobacteraceae bacterium]